MWHYAVRVMGRSFRSAWGIAGHASLIALLIGGFVAYERPTLINEANAFMWVLPLAVLVFFALFGMVAAGYKVYREREQELERAAAEATRQHEKGQATLRDEILRLKQDRGDGREVPTPSEFAGKVRAETSRLFQDLSDVERAALRRIAISGGQSMADVVEHLKAQGHPSHHVTKAVMSLKEHGLISFDSLRKRWALDSHFEPYVQELVATTPE
jgi:hypothetical protein